jgi:hypothetical protein
MKHQSETKPISADGNRLFFRRLANVQAFAFRPIIFLPDLKIPTWPLTNGATPLEADEYLRRPFEASKEQRPSLSDQGQVSDVSRRRLPPGQQGESKGLDVFLREDADVETSDQHPIFARHSCPARNAFRT